jgi:hypothetical protein
LIRPVAALPARNSSAACGPMVDAPRDPVSSGTVNILPSICTMIVGLAALDEPKIPTWIGISHRWFSIGESGLVSPQRSGRHARNSP